MASGVHDDAGDDLLTVDVIRDLSELTRRDGPLARIDWPGFDAEPEVAVELAAARGSRFRPYVIVVRKRTEIVAAAMMRIDDAELTVKLGHRLAYRPRCLALIAQHGGIFGANDEESSHALIHAVREALQEERATAALLPGIRVDSSLALTSTQVPSLFRAHFEQRRIHRRTSLPSSREEFLAARSRNTRRTVARVERTVIERTVRPHVRLFTRSFDFDELMGELEQVASRTWQRALGGGFKITPIELALYRAAMSRDAFRAWLLYDDTRPIAFLVGLAHRDVLSGRYMGYDPQYADCSPGVYLFSQLVGDLCADERIRRYDFGPGDSQFKRIFADESWLESDVVLFSSRARAVATNLVRSTMSATAYVAKRAVTRYDTLGGLWMRRHGITGEATSGNPLRPAS